MNGKEGERFVENEVERKVGKEQSEVGEKAVMEER